MFKSLVETLDKQTGETSADAVVKGLAENIKRRVEDAMAGKQTSTTILLPIVFPELPDLTDGEAMLVVYGRLLSSLEETGRFKMSMEHEHAVTKLHLRWRPLINKQLAEEYAAILDKYRLESGEKKTTPAAPTPSRRGGQGGRR